MVAPAVQCEELLTRSGLLLPCCGDKAAFHHLSFQEFLAAERIAKTTDEGSTLEQVFSERGSVPEWRPTLLFLFAGQVFNYRRPEWGLQLLGRLIADQVRRVRTNPAPAALIGTTTLGSVCCVGPRLPVPCVVRRLRVPGGRVGSWIVSQSRTSRSMMAAFLSQSWRFVSAKSAK